ncbi:MAG: S8 family serine peptidase [Candidatus Thiodiazotropha sp.]
MIDGNYIVLRTKNVFIPTLENLGMAGRAEVSSFSQGSLEIEEVMLSASDRHDLRQDPNTHAIAPAMPMQLIEPVESSSVAVTADTEHTWGIEAVKATDSNFDGNGITVAVLDTGIDPNHPAFAGINLVRKNFTSEGDDDQNGHGTHCAGTIFGQDVERTRIGIARNIERALIGKVLGLGGGSSATIAKAIQWAVNEGAHVVSMSLGIDFPGFVERLTQDYGYHVKPATSLALEAYRANINLFSELARFVQAQSVFGNGSIIIAASGNESNRPEYEIAVAPPAAGTGIIAVGALGQEANTLTVAKFSNTQVDISAPGVGVISAIPGSGLGSKSGTSMATPHVAGVATLWAQRQNDTTGHVNRELLISQLIATATMEPLESVTQAEDVGAGIVQAPIN